MANMMYGPAIYDAVARDDVAEMRRLLAEAEQHLEQWGNVPLAVELLKAELKKAEYREGSS